MTKLQIVYILTLFILIIWHEKSFAIEPLWKQASDYEESGNYSEAIRVRMQMARDDEETEWYLDDVAAIARCYSFLAKNDSVIKYCQLSETLAKKLINSSDSIAEEYLQNSSWSLYRCGEYDLALQSARTVLNLRDKIHGVGSDKYFEWLEVMSYQALQADRLRDVLEFCELEIQIAEKMYGLNSLQFENAISTIRAFAHQVVDFNPEFTVKWTLPYYQKLTDNNILPQFQYEFEILQMEGFLTLGDLQSADKYAHKLESRTYSDVIPLEDKLRIWLKLANYDMNIGDLAKARWRLSESDKLLMDANASLTMPLLMDRHNVELTLKYDQAGISRINAEWLIETSTPILESGIEDAGTLSFFYNSRAWAYEGLNEYDMAIDDIKKSIDLNPLYSRKKKLGQLYLQKRDFIAAENTFLDLINDETLSDVARESVEADLMALYWLKEDKENLALYIAKDIENVKMGTRNAFAFLNEKERETFLNNSLLGTSIYFDMYTSFSSGDSQWAKGNEMAYNLALMQKGLLLNTTREISDIFENLPDSLHNDLKLYKDLCKLDKIPDSESSPARVARLKLMNYVTSNPDFMAQLNDNWENIAERLTDRDAAIEFINLLGCQSDNLDNFKPSLGALILRKDSKCPIFVKLASNEDISNIYVYGDDDERFSDEIYSGEEKELMYNAIWEPLSAYLDGIDNIFYAPAGMMQEINMDWIGIDDTHNLSDDFNLYRVSSTREILNLRNNVRKKDAVLYGDITYSIASYPNNTLPESKYRSTTRSGFSPLYKTAEEIDSIAFELDMRNITSVDYRKHIATEGSFRNISGDSPSVLHIATHGFYYSPDAIKKKLEYGNFMAFQGMNPELYHSGLALSGAQDTWNYGKNPEDISKYFELDSENDGILLSAEIAEMDLSNTDLVVLSACETALGNVTSEGVYGLQRAFKLAGVNSLLMSLWKVDDDATQLLMTNFYKNYLGGMSKREALLTAQKKVRETPGFEAPYNWAAFILLDGLN